MIHRFEDVEVDTELVEVRVGGQPHSIEPQVLQVLHHLITHRERVVSKEELLDEIWGTRFVSDASITSRIKSARQAIGDSGSAQRFVRTVHGRGYRFVGGLEEGAVSPATPSETSDAQQPVPTPTTWVRRADDGWPLVGRDAELTELAELALSDRVGGVLLSGPAGIGKTRLTRAVVERCEHAGRPIARINGHTEAATIPLAALAHVLPSDIADATDLRGELAETRLLERARLAIAALGGDQRPVLMVDDVDRVDRLSRALLGSLMSAGSVTVVMTQRDAGANPAFGDLISSGHVARIDLGPVGQDHLTELLTVVLDGPVRPDTTSAMIAAADGSPGLLRQLVEASRDAGTLIRDRSGIWHLSGSITTSSDLVAVIGDRLEGLHDDQRRAAELLALAGELPLDLAFELIDDEVLDALELAGLVSVRDVVREPRVRLAHPLFEDVLRKQVTPLRERTLRKQVADGLAGWIGSGRSVQPADRLQLVRHRLSGDGSLDDRLAIESARYALLEGDVSLANRIIDRSSGDDPTDRARLDQLRAEGLFVHGRFVDAGHVLRAIDIDVLPDDEAADVVRRIATSIFYGYWRQRDAIDHLAEHFERFDGVDRSRLEAYWVMLAALDGREAAAAIELGTAVLTTATDFVRAEALAGVAMGHFIRGELERAVGLLDECARQIAELPASLTWVGPDYSWFAEITTLTELGRIDEAWRVVDRTIGPDGVPSLGFHALSVGRLAHRSGRSEQALVWLTPLVQLADAIDLTTNARPMQATTARAALAVGDHERARAEAAVLDSMLDDEWSLVTLDLLETVCRVEGVLGDAARAVDRLIQGATFARDVGNTIMEASLLGAAVEFGGATRVIDRLRELADLVDPGLLQLKITHAEAMIAGVGPDAVAAEYERIGLRQVAADVRASVHA